MTVVRGEDGKSLCSHCGLSPHGDAACPDELAAVRLVAETALKELASSRAEADALGKRAAEAEASWETMQTELDDLTGQLIDHHKALAQEREKVEKLRLALQSISGCHGLGPAIHALIADVLKETAP